MSGVSLGSNHVCISGFLLTTSLFLGVGGRGFANPSTIFVCLAAVLHTLDVAWTIAFDDGHELIPVQFTEVIVSAFFVPFQIWVRQGQAQSFCLRNDHVDEALAQLVVGETLNLPGHGLLGVW